MGKHFFSRIAMMYRTSVINIIITTFALLTLLLLCNGCDDGTTTLAESNGSFEILKDGLPINWTFNPASFKKKIQILSSTLHIRKMGNRH